jgi:hypothetical protein
VSREVRLRQIPSTGFAGFDEALQALFELDQAKAEETIRTADGDLSKIAAGISHDAIRAALSLEDDDQVKQLSRAHPRQLTRLFDEAREISRRLFGTILKDPEKRAQLARIIHGGVGFWEVSGD